MKKVGVSELKTHCLSIVDGVARTGETVLVSRHGKVVARIVPASADDTGYPQQGLEGSVRTQGDLLSPLFSDAEIETAAERAIRPTGARKVKPSAK